MEIIKTLQCCWIDRKNDLQRNYTRVLFRQDGALFVGQCPSHQYSAGDKLQTITPLPDAAWQPIAPPGCTMAPDPGSCYVKKPDLFFIDDNTAGLVLKEVTACEIIKRNPHPNIATYHGCVVSNGRVTELCFERYPETLAEKVNPGYLNKAEFIASDETKQAREVASAYLQGIEAGIKHLHSLGLVHNDLNPRNVMITEEGIPVIIDFDACCAPGTALMKLGTPGWIDPEVRESKVSNDLDALNEMRVYLMGSEPGEFQFEV